MVYGMWLSADGLLAQQQRQDVIANNLANVDTPGFKPDRVAFAERLNESLLRASSGTSLPSLGQSTGGLFARTDYTDYTQGGVLPTGNKLDVALLDKGFLKVQTPDGVFYTRDGRMTTDQSGALRHAASNGYVLSSQDQPLRVEVGSKDPVAIDQTGRIRQGTNIVGDIGVTDFENPQLLDKLGKNLYSADRAAPFPVRPMVRQGFVEASGVEPSRALVDMIAASRAYEMGASLISMQDESLGRLVNDVGRIG